MNPTRIMNPEDLADTFSAALPELQQSVELAGNPALLPAQRLTAANAFAELLAELWESLAPLGAHVSELLAFLDSLVTGLPEQADAAEAVPVLELMALLGAYLETPQDPEIVDALVDLATSEVFDPPLTSAVAQLWLDRKDAELPDCAVPQCAAALTLDAADESAAEPFAAKREVVERPPPDSTLPALSDEAHELLALLASAAEDSHDELLRCIAAIADASDPADRANAALACQEILVCFADAASQAGFAAFATVCASLGYQLAALSPAAPWPASLLAELMQLSQRIQAYLDDPLDESPRQALVALLSDRHWPERISPDNAAALILELYREPLLLEDEIRPARATEVANDELSLAPTEGIEASVLTSFRREGPELVRRFTQAIQSASAGGEVEDALRQAQRFAHTIKGSANVCGVQAIATLSHHLEDLLDFLVEQGSGPHPALGDALASGADGLALMFDILNGREPDAPAQLRPIMQEVLDWANRIDRQGGAGLADASRQTPPSEPEAPADPGIALKETPPGVRIAPDAPADSEEIALLQVPASAIDDLLRLVGELSIALAQSEEQLGQAHRALDESGAIEQRNLLQIAELEKLVDLKGLGIQSVGRAGADNAFDPLELEHYNEMYIATRRLNEGVNDVRELSQTLDGTLRHLGELMQQQIKLGRELRQLTMSTRQVPARTIETRLLRTVRQTCRTTGKAAELSLLGGEVRIDGELLDLATPALMHVLRNAIDHGIEPEEIRERAGKPRAGRIAVQFRQVGSQIEVSIDDDGCGLDLERVRTRAIARGLLAPAARPTDQELALLTLKPGFSTREQVDQVSGRGVGMDVVATTFRALNGTLAIASEPGRGYRLTARFPASRVSIYCLLIRCQELLLAVPATEISQATLTEASQIAATAEGWSLRDGECVYPLVHLNTLLGLPAPALGHGRQAALLTETDAGTQALMVDAVIEGRELVAMPLRCLVPRSPGLMAASILGNGRVVPIVELRAVLRAVGTEFATLSGTAALPEPVSLPTVLIVDDSISMRKLLSRLVADGGYRPLTAHDGMDALRIMDRENVNLLLVDLEMPRMNGLELTAHLRAQPATVRVPIAMLTSRSTEKHRREAFQAGVDEYFVKPYREEAVLDFLQQACTPLATTDSKRI